MIWPSNGHIPQLEPLNVHIPQLCTCKICTKKVWISSFHLKEGAQGLTLTLCFSTGWFEALPKVGEWVIWEKLAICNTSRDNSHILIFSRRVISYGSETSLLVMGIASKLHGRLIVHFSERWSSHNRTNVGYSRKHIPGWSICRCGRNNVVSTFRIYRKHSLPVNMAADINKQKLRDKSVKLLRKKPKIFVNKAWMCRNITIYYEIFKKNDESMYTSSGSIIAPTVNFDQPFDVCRQSFHHYSLCEGPCKSRWMSYLRKNWLSAILFRDNSHLLILSRWVISYRCETSPSESSPKSRWMSYLRKIGYLQYF